jgi:Zn-dependent peptidase ImmA (M78 family)
MNRDLFEKSLLKSLIDDTIPFADVMNAYNVRTTLSDQLPSHVLGFVYVSRRGNYHLILNAEVSLETRVKTFVHEIKHIVCDLPKVGYMIGLDMQRSQLELEADYVAEELAGYVVGG